MYLILTIKEAQERNRKEAINRNCEKGTNFWWYSIPLINGVMIGENDTDEDVTHLALNVGDGDGLTKDELRICVDELPELEQDGNNN